MSDDEETQALRLLRDFAHEVRTPLTAMIGYTDLLAKVDELKLDPERVQAYCLSVNKASHRLLELCERVLDDALDPAALVRLQSVHVAELGAELLNLFAAKAAKAGVDLRLNVSDDFPVIQSDPFILREILVNLVNNAINYTPRGGRVEVRAVLDQEKRALILVVQDNGKGIPLHVVKRLMEGQRVTTGSRAGGNPGWGRGFQIVRSHAERLSADLDVSSEKGQGTVVSLRLPISG